MTRGTGALCVGVLAWMTVVESGVLLRAQPGQTPQSPAGAPSPSAAYTSGGEMLRPEAYREWIYLSSGLGMVYGPAAAAVAGRPPSFTNVFVNPAAHRQFMATGTWPDETVMVLEIRSSASEASINRGGSFQTDVVAVEAAVKDRKRFADGWAYFNFGARGDRAAPLPPTASCYSCHKANAAVDQTFVQFYPTLMPVAQRFGTVRADYQHQPAPAKPAEGPR